MQLVTSLTMYEVKFPPNIEIQMRYLRSIIAGEMLKPDFMIRVLWPGKTLLSLMSGKAIAPQKGNIQSSGMKSGNIFVNLSQYFVVLGLGLIVLLIMGAASVIIKSKREMIKEKLIKFKKDFIFNGLIKSLNFSYLPFCISISASI